MTLVEFIKGFFTDKEMTNMLKYMGETEYNFQAAASMVRDARHPTLKAAKFIKVVEYNDADGADHDHGQWNESAVIEKDGKFFKFVFSYYGQGELEVEGYDHLPMEEVKPRTITKVIYEKI